MTWWTCGCRTRESSCPGRVRSSAWRRGAVLGELVRLADLRAEPVRAPLDALVYLVGAIGPGADVALPPMMPVARADGRVARLLPVDRIG